jgi:hypothetical protein
LTGEQRIEDDALLCAVGAGRDEARMRSIAFLLAGLAAFGWSSVASAADPPATAGVLQFGVGFRYGVDMMEGDVNPWGTGLGLNVGYTMPNAIYLGGNAEYFFGESEETPISEVSFNVWQLTAEGGYDVGLGKEFVLRPKIGLGIGTLRGKACFDLGMGEECTSDSESEFAAIPGATFLYLGQSFSLGVDVRYAMIFAEETADALIFSVGVGF